MVGYKEKVGVIAKEVTKKSISEYLVKGIIGKIKRKKR